MAHSQPELIPSLAHALRLTYRIWFLAKAKRLTAVLLTAGQNWSLAHARRPTAVLSPSHMRHYLIKVRRNVTVSDIFCWQIGVWVAGILIIHCQYMRIRTERTKYDEPSWSLGDYKRKSNLFARLSMTNWQTRTNELGAEIGIFC